MGRLFALVLLLLLAVACGDDGSSLAPPPPPAQTAQSGGEAGFVEVARGLDRPVYLAGDPRNPDRLYVVEQAGVVRMIEGGRLAVEPFLDIRDLVITSPKGEFASEQGLLSIAFANGRAFVSFTDRGGRVVVAEYRIRGGRADRASARSLLVVEKDEPEHNGGQLQIGPDGALYVGLGDDDSSPSRAQSLEASERLGKILRLDLGDPRAEWEVVAYGLRNPWRFSFDRATGDLWIGDVGESRWEEIDVLPRDRDGVVNLGWDGYEGYERYHWDGERFREPAGAAGLVWPVAVYGHEQGCAVTGGYVYRGREVEAARGRYFYGDYCTGAVWSLAPDRPAEIRLEFRLPATLASFGEDAAGELYLVSRTGRLFRLTAGG